MKFLGKIALVVGGTRGLGLTIAKHITAQGAVCYITGRNVEDGEQAAKELGDNGRFVMCDATDLGAVENLFSIIKQEHGKLDLAVNNAGVTTPRSEIIDLDYAEWKRVLEINLLGPLLCMSHEMKLMAQDGGAIVNTSSCAGLMGVPQQSVYSTSKAALNTLTQVAAIECAQETENRKQIRVNAVCPGPTLGGMNTEERLKANPEGTKHKFKVTAMKRFAHADEVASAVTWLLSDESSYITGSIVPVDGGYSAGKFD
ncbi:alcohol dehydrogenase [Pseudoalteromonas sp. MSK9-3]|uniref:SDR family NAD(P)-dependent oxidoreductase n=1 Tax=Pseudoalteromonas sp. MSK9-3 TaxID=1897633 RepID=UPI000E6CAE5C|nr:SDR family oxidoreductase [Pseudoalteromonas sp. MSK9-3]RJE77176.1 alcohol dehydrogenase [Pseudoalteromonas sp. MSK9-3]